nr:immunoglobulin domain-containing protein [Lachnospiraceae bacterium]
MKRVFTILLVLAMCAGLLQVPVSTVHAIGNVAITGINFPDSTFRNYVKDFDTNGDLELSPSEIAAVTEIQLYQVGTVHSLKGVEYFTNITFLQCNNNSLEELDVSHNPYLRALYIDNNDLSELDLTQNAALKFLSCYGNNISRLDLRGCPNLLETIEYGWQSVEKDPDTGQRYYRYEYEDYDEEDSQEAWYFLDVDKDTVLITDDVEPPVITSNPKSVTVNEGETATFKVRAAGTDLTYQWWYRKSPSESYTKVKNNGTSATYKLTTQARHNGYQYKCRVRNSAGVVQSTVATLTVVSPPKITTEPKSVTVAEGEVATFKVAASGTGLTYQWWYRKSPSESFTKVKNNGTSATYKLTTQARHNGYEYKCRVRNSAGVVQSNYVKLTVVTEPDIVTQPKSTTVNAGQTATFKVTASGTGLKYQWWYRTSSSGSWTKVTVNGTSATYKVTAQARHNGYQYKCKITNIAGSVITNVVKLTVK